ncbi:MAG: TrmH family RNA methyltransferase [Candidatus Paceibacterota bacterium]|jgi:tRNA G18 (ribose-2'-O)-methylase SpoU
MKGEIIAVLHNIRSIHNVGSIFRTADAARVSKLYLCGITPAPLDRFGKTRQDFAKVSLGAEKTVAYESVRSILPLLTKLKKEGYVIVAVELVKGAVPYYSLRRTLNNKKIVLVLGNEVDGLSKSILTRTDIITEIPMQGKKESLNVSVAFGIVAYGIQY